MANLNRLPHHPWRDRGARLLLLLLLLLVAVAALVARTARAQVFPFDAHDAPNLAPTDGDSGGLGAWLEENKWWLLFTLAIGAAAFLVWSIFRQDTRTKRLQRDALEKLRKGLIQSCRATRGPARRVVLTGSPRDPPARLGRYLGHHRSMEATWICYRTWLFGRARLLCVNPVDVSSLDVPTIHVRAIGVCIGRDLGFATPDVHDRAQLADWQHAVRVLLAAPDDFAEAVKDYYARSVDNAIAFFDAMSAAEDRSFLRQEVTRSPDELTETIVVPVPPPAQPKEAPTDA